MTDDETPQQPSPPSGNKRPIAFVVASILVVGAAIAGILLATDGSEEAGATGGSDNVASSANADQQFLEWVEHSSIPPSAAEQALEAAKSNCQLLDEGFGMEGVHRAIVEGQVPTDIARDVLTGMAMSVCSHHRGEITRWIASH